VKAIILANCMLKGGDALTEVLEVDIEIWGKARFFLQPRLTKWRGFRHVFPLVMV
jgi:hypothetical protein